MSCNNNGVSRRKPRLMCLAPSYWCSEALSHIYPMIQWLDDKLKCFQWVDIKILEYILNEVYGREPWKGARALLVCWVCKLKLLDASKAAIKLLEHFCKGTHLHLCHYIVLYCGCFGILVMEGILLISLTRNSTIFYNIVGWYPSAMANRALHHDYR